MGWRPIEVSAELYAWNLTTWYPVATSTLVYTHHGSSFGLAHGLRGRRLLPSAEQQQQQQQQQQQRQRHERSAPSATIARSSARRQSSPACWHQLRGLHLPPSPSRCAATAAVAFIWTPPPPSRVPLSPSPLTAAFGRCSWCRAFPMLAACTCIVVLVARSCIVVCTEAALECMDAWHLPLFGGSLGCVEQVAKTRVAFRRSFSERGASRR